MFGLSTHSFYQGIDSLSSARLLSSCNAKSSAMALSVPPSSRSLDNWPTSSVDDGP